MKDIFLFWYFEINKNLSKKTYLLENGATYKS